MPPNPGEALHDGLIDTMNNDFFDAVRRIVEQGGAKSVPHAGLDLKDETAGLESPELRAVGGLFLTPGPDAKRWIAHWNHVRGADYYEVQTNPDPARSWGWSESFQVHDRSTIVRERPTDRRLWVRVRAVNMWRRGPWSDPISITSVIEAISASGDNTRQAA